MKLVRAVLGLSRPPVRQSCVSLVPSWAVLGPLAPARGSLGPSWGPLGRMVGVWWPLSGHLGTVLDLPRPSWVPREALLGPSWGRPGCFSGQARSPRGPEKAENNALGFFGPCWRFLVALLGHPRTVEDRPQPPQLLILADRRIVSVVAVTLKCAALSLADRRAVSACSSRVG
eukprot:2761318-Pyramimonas_sp.AAC.1